MPTPHCSTSIGYNERKVAEGTASVVLIMNIDNPKRPLETFERYERGSRRCEKPSFHMSINPSVTDNLTEEQIVDLARELMAGLGYKDQPVIIYKHNDIQREHYHVVSVRVDKNGRKIDDFNERRRCQQILKRLALKYDYVVGKKEVKNADAPRQKSKESGYLRFDPSAGNYMQQIELLVQQAMKYHFATEAQFVMLMKEFGVEVTVGKESQRFYAGLDLKTGRPCTAPIPSRNLHVPTDEMLKEHMERALAEKRTREKQRVANLARTALSKCSSELHLERYLKKFGICVVFSMTHAGEIFGVTFIDHRTRNVFKCSELEGLSAKEFEKARMEKWPKEEGSESNEKSSDKHLADDVVEVALAGLVQERSRRNEDEEIMRRAKHQR